MLTIVTLDDTVRETTLNVMASVNGTSFVSYVNITERGFLIIILLI